ncbi:MAG: hypothetical protein LWX02_07255 [Deltaproteobacteria bacterium]|nr:hypothetical protein [Deltaproteobacteria bacterium]MDL1987590.1 hypothetical protein [Deltaproteobacteria bacterium]
MDITKSLQDLSLFIETERKHYSGKCGNLFAVSCAQFIRYLEFLEIIYFRYKAAETGSTKLFDDLLAQSKKAENGPISTDSMKLLESSRAANRLLHLETESFFIFAKLYLDKLAQFIENYFGSGHGASLRSHTKLHKKFDHYKAQKKLKVPEVFIKDIEWFNNVVTHTRDKQITHQKNSRSLFGTSFSAAGSAKIVTIQLFPGEHDSQSNSPNIDEVVKRLIRYTDRLVRLIKRNRKSSRYEQKI